LLTGMLRFKSHTVHLSSHPAYPPRSRVNNVSWNEEEPNYQPTNFTHPVVLENDRSKNPKGWADPVDWTFELRNEVSQRTSNALVPNGKVIIRNGFPRNPIGRTGMIGRGLLGKYGPNYAADPLVTRYDPETGNLQMVAILRKDIGQWAIPGGMVDEGENVSTTLQREFFEESQNYTGNEKVEMTQKLEKLFRSGGKLIFTGYVDDPRNTDYSWMETVCVHFHIDDPHLAANLKLVGGDDASQARWLNIDDSEEHFRKLYASHRKMVIQALLLEKEKYASTIKQIQLMV